MLERHIVGKSEESGQADNGSGRGESSIASSSSLSVRLKNKQAALSLVRFKRSTRDWVRERTVEVLVVVDFRTSYEHGRETEQYALTLMNMVRPREPTGRKEKENTESTHLLYCVVSVFPSTGT